MMHLRKMGKTCWGMTLCLSEINDGNPIYISITKEAREAAKKLNPAIVPTLYGWIFTGRLGGEWFTAVMGNDLMRGVCRADSKNLEKLPELMSWLNTYAPYDCYGSPERVLAWASATERTPERTSIVEGSNK